MSTIVVEIWSDVVCPWCAIGKRRFDQAVANTRSKRPGIEFEIGFRAFELDPSAPVGLDQSVFDVYAKKFGGADAARAMMERVTETAAADGIEFRLDIAQRSNTRMAHRLLVFAEHHGKQHALKDRLMAAYFTEGQRIGDTETLVELAVDVGLGTAAAREWLLSDGGASEVNEQLAMAGQLGITGVPTFVFTDPTTGERFGIPGAAAADTFEAVFERLIQLEGQ